MEYTEFTCDNLPDLETLERGSMVQLPDGSWAQQVVFVGAPVTPDSWDDASDFGGGDAWADDGIGTDTWNDN